MATSGDRAKAVSRTTKDNKKLHNNSDYERHDDAKNINIDKFTNANGDGIQSRSEKELRRINKIDRQSFETDIRPTKTTGASKPLSKLALDTTEKKDRASGTPEAKTTIHKKRDELEDSGYYDNTSRRTSHNSDTLVEDIDEEPRFVILDDDYEAEEKQNKKVRTDLRKQRAKTLKGKVDKEARLHKRRASLTTETTRINEKLNSARRLSIDGEILNISSSDSEADADGQTNSNIDTLILLHKLKHFIKQHVPEPITKPDQRRDIDITSENRHQNVEVQQPIAVSENEKDCTPVASPIRKRVVPKQNAVDSSVLRSSTSIPSIELQDENNKTQTLLESNAVPETVQIMPGILRPGFKMDLGDLSDADEVFTVQAVPSSPRSRRKQMTKTESIKSESGDGAAGLVYDVNDVSEITPEQLREMGIVLKEGEVLKFRSVLILDDDEDSKQNTKSKVGGKYNHHIIPLSDDKDGVTDTEIDEITKQAEKFLEVQPKRQTFAPNQALTAPVGYRRALSCPLRSPPRTPTLTRDTYRRFFETSRGNAHLSNEDSPIVRAHQKLMDDLNSIQCDKQARGEDISGLGGYHKSYLRQERKFSSDSDDSTGVLVYPNVIRGDQPIVASDIELRRELLTKNLERDAQKQPQFERERAFSVTNFMNVRNSFEKKATEENSRSERPRSCVELPTNPVRNARENFDMPRKTDKFQNVGKSWDRGVPFQSARTTIKPDKQTQKEPDSRATSTKKTEFTDANRSKVLTSATEDEELVVLRSARSRERVTSAPAKMGQVKEEDWFAASFNTSKHVNPPPQRRDYSPFREEESDWFFQASGNDAGLNTNNNNLSNNANTVRLDFLMPHHLNLVKAEELKAVPRKKYLETEKNVQKESIESQLAVLCGGLERYQLGDSWINHEPVTSENWTQSSQKSQLSTQKMESVNASYTGPKSRDVQSQCLEYEERSRALVRDTSSQTATDRLLCESPVRIRLSRSPVRADMNEIPDPINASQSPPCGKLSKSAGHVGRNQSPERAKPTQSLGRGERSYSPERGRPFRSPEREKRSFTPESGRPSQSPGRGRRIYSPERERRSYSPERERPSQSHGHERRSFTPERERPSQSHGRERRSYSPERERTSQSHGRERRSYSPERERPSQSHGRERQSYSPERERPSQSHGRERRSYSPENERPSQSQGRERRYYSPERGRPSKSPQRGKLSQSPGRGGRSYSHERGRPSQSPERERHSQRQGPGGRSYSPERGGRSYSPDRGKPFQSPERLIRSFSPENRRTPQSPGHRRRSDSLERGKPSHTTESRPSQSYGRRDRSYSPAREKSQSLERGRRTISPERGRSSQSPELGRPLQSPGRGMRPYSPERGRPSQVPGRRDRSYSPVREKPSQSPGRERRTFSPERERPSQSSGRRDRSHSRERERPSQNPERGRPSTSPRRVRRSNSLEREKPSHNPENGVRSHSPERGKPSHTPGHGRRSFSPEGEKPSQNPGRGGRSHSTERGKPAKTPERVEVSQSTVRSGVAWSPLPERSSKSPVRGRQSKSPGRERPSESPVVVGLSHSNVCSEFVPSHLPEKPSRIPVPGRTSPNPGRTSPSAGRGGPPHSPVNGRQSKSPVPIGESQNSVRSGLVRSPLPETSSRIPVRQWDERPDGSKHTSQASHPVAKKQKHDIAPLRAANTDAKHKGSKPKLKKHISLPTALDLIDYSSRSEDRRARRVKERTKDVLPKPVPPKSPMPSTGVTSQSKASNPSATQKPPSTTKQQSMIKQRPNRTRLDTEVFDDELGHLSDSSCIPVRNSCDRSRADSGYMSLSEPPLTQSMNKALIDLINESDNYASDDELFRQKCLDVFKTWHHEDIVHKQFRKLLRFRSASRRASITKNSFTIIADCSGTSGTGSTSSTSSDMDKTSGGVVNHAPLRNSLATQTSTPIPRG